MLDGTETKNKMVDEAQNKAELPTSAKAVSGLLNEYFFPGGGVWKPMSVIAASVEEAQALHREKRVPVEEPKEETTNES